MKRGGLIRLLLGPQRPTANLPDAIAMTPWPDGPLAVISAGWQEAEADIDDVRELAQRPVEDLRLYHRTEEVFKSDSGLAIAYRARQDRLKEQQRLYRLRLRQLAIAARHTLRATGDPEMITAEQRHAVAQLRALDRHHMHRTETIHAQFDAEFNPSRTPLLATHAADIEAIIARSSGVLLTGGNVVVLLNRIRLFQVQQQLKQAHVVAWSAGAMVLAERVVLFHDRAPQGRRDAELLGAGCGLLAGRVLFPDAQRRLRKEERVRMSLLSRRFAPDQCVMLDSGSALHLSGDAIIGAVGVKRLHRKGHARRMESA